MTARFAYRRPKALANAVAAAKPARTPALPAASLPKGSLPAPRAAFKEVSVFHAGGVDRTNILIPMSEYEHMKSFAGESDAAVESACLEASKVIAAEADRTWSETVASGAMLQLMAAFQSKRKAQSRRKVTRSRTRASLASEGYFLELSAANAVRCTQRNNCS